MRTNNLYSIESIDFDYFEKVENDDPVMTANNKSEAQF
jgi:hypothetical protein